MTLAALIRKRDTRKPANANPAKAANDASVTQEPLARLATLALANMTGPDADQWQEFESLLAIVGSAYRTPAHEYVAMREAAANDLERHGHLLWFNSMT